MSRPDTVSFGQALARATVDPIAAGNVGDLATLGLQHGVEVWRVGREVIGEEVLEQRAVECRLTVGTMSPKSPHATPPPFR